jgi:hypothetical protein
MFTMNMVNGVMKPMLNGQPGLIEPSLQWFVLQTTQHLTAVNWLIAIVQILLGLGFLLLPTRWIKLRKTLVERHVMRACFPGKVCVGS